MICSEESHENEQKRPSQWPRLPLVGIQEDGDGGFCELRNCDRCASTLAVPLPTGGAS